MSPQQGLTQPPKTRRGFVHLVPEVVRKIKQWTRHMPGFLRICHTLKGNEGVHIQCGLPSLLPFPASCLKLMSSRTRQVMGVSAVGLLGRHQGLLGNWTAHRAWLPSCPAQVSVLPGCPGSVPDCLFVKLLTLAPVKGAVASP